MSRPQKPCSAPVESSLWILLWSQSISYLVCLCYCCIPFFFQHYCLFQRNLPSHDVTEVGQLQFHHLCLQWCFRLTTQLLCSKHLFTRLMNHSIFFHNRRASLLLIFSTSFLFLSGAIVCSNILTERERCFLFIGSVSPSLFCKCEPIR